MSATPSIIIQIPFQRLRQYAPIPQIILNKLYVLPALWEKFLHKVAINQCAGSYADPFLVVGIRPILQVPHKTVLHWIGMNVTAQMQQVIVVKDRLGLEVAFKQGARMLVPLVVCLDVAVIHALWQQAGGMVPIDP